MIRQLLEEVKAAPARRGQPQPPQGDPPGLHQGARGRAGARAGRGAGAADAPLHRGGHPVRGRAADRAGPAGGLARGALPRHPDRDLRPADGGPQPARADAQALPPGHARRGPRPVAAAGDAHHADGRAARRRASPAGCTSERDGYSRRAVRRCDHRRGAQRNTENPGSPARARRGPAGRSATGRRSARGCRPWCARQTAARWPPETDQQDRAGQRREAMSRPATQPPDDDEPEQPDEDQRAARGGEPRERRGRGVLDQGAGRGRRRRRLDACPVPRMPSTCGDPVGVDAGRCRRSWWRRTAGRLRGR